jgi:hypothetical protein
LTGPEKRAEIPVKKRYAVPHGQVFPGFFDVFVPLVRADEQGSAETVKVPLPGRFRGLFQPQPVTVVTAAGPRITAGFNGIQPPKKQAESVFVNFQQFKTFFPGKNF